MPANWTAPRTWVDLQTVNAADMNEQLRDNLLWLKGPPGLQTILAADVNTTSTSFVDVTGMSLTMTTTGGSVLIQLSALMKTPLSIAEIAEIRFMVDGVPQGIMARQRFVSPGVVEDHLHVAPSLLYPVMAAGSHTIKVQWRSVGGNAVYMLGQSVLGNWSSFRIAEVGWK